MIRPKETMANLQTSAIAVIVVTCIFVVGAFVYFNQPFLSFAGGELGRGVEVQVTADEHLKQPVALSSEEEIQSLFVMVPPDTHAQIDLTYYPSDRADSIFLGRSNVQSILRDESHIDALAWNIKRHHLRSITGVLEFSPVVSNPTSVKIIGDERDPRSKDAAVLVNSEEPTPQSLAVSVALAKHDTYFEMASESEQLDILLFAVKGLLIAIIMVGILLIPSVSNIFSRIYVRIGIIAVLVIAGIGIRVWFANALPLINDEQFYVYDSILFDIHNAQFWKTPVLITALRMWTFITGIHSLPMLRMLVVLTSVMSVVLFARVARIIAGPAAQYGTLAIGLLFPPIPAFSAAVMTEQLLWLPISFALYLIFTYRQKHRMPWFSLLLISACIGIAIATRWSSIFWAIPVLVLLRTRSIREYARRVLWLVAPFCIALIPFMYKFSDIFVKYQIKGIFVEFFEQSAANGWLMKFNEWRDALIRISLLLVMSCWIFISRSKQQRIIYAIAVVSFLLIFAKQWLASELLPFYPAQKIILPLLLIGMFIPGLVSIHGNTNSQSWELILLLLPPIAAYSIFHKVNPKYIAEFLPSIIILAGIGFGNVVRAVIYQKSWSASIAILCLGWATLPWLGFSIEKPYAGTLSINAVQETVQYLRAHVPAGEPVLTGSSLLPILADRSPAFPISHPSWIEPEFRGQKDPRYDALFDPVVATLEKGVIPWIVDEKLTTDTYRNHPRIDDIIQSRYTPVAEFENDGSRAITVLHINK